MSRAPGWRPQLRRLLLAAVVAVLLSGAGAAAAAVNGGPTLNWYTVDGGGGASSGGAYRVDGTLGQPDAGALSGAGYTLQGGFWSAAPVGYRLFLPVVQK